MNVATPVEHAVLHVTFKVDGAEYAVPASAVLQLEAYSGATPVPGAPPFVTGIVQLRGRVVPVVDLRLRFGLPSRDPTLESRLVVVEHGERTVALLADSAREVVRIAPSMMRPPPSLVRSDVVHAIAQLAEHTILVLDLSSLIGEEGDGGEQRGHHSLGS